MKTFLIRIQRPDTPAWIVDKKGTLVTSLTPSELENLEASQSSHQGVLDIITSAHEHLREFSLPAKSLEQFKKMVPHQIRSLNPASSTHHSWVYECFPIPRSHPQQISAIVLAHDANQWEVLSDHDGKKNHLSHGKMSETLALLYAYHEPLTQGQHSRHIFHQHHETLWHFYASKDHGRDELHVQVLHLAMGSAQCISETVIQLIQQAHHWQVPNQLQIHMNTAFEVDLQSDIIKTLGAQPLALGQACSHDERLLLGACRALQESSSLPTPFDENTQSHTDNASQLKNVHYVGISLLFLLGTWWLSNMLTQQEWTAHSQNLLRYLQNIHKQTLPAGQRRHFSEMTLVKRLELAAKAQGQNQESEASFMHFFSELQAHLQRCPDFQCERIQSQTHEGKFQIQGLVSTVQHFDELTHVFQENKKWKVQSNFTRSSGSKQHGFKVNLSIEVLP